jgi:hypothetical protein
MLTTQMLHRTSVDAEYRLGVRLDGWPDPYGLHGQIRPGAFLLIDPIVTQNVNALLIELRAPSAQLLMD